VVLAVITFSSCRTTRNVAFEELKPMSTNRIVRKLEREAPNYNNYESKRVSITYNDNGEKNNFTGQFIINRDKSILITARKLNIPLGRGYITPDSVIFINYFDKNYIRDHIEELHNFIGFGVDYEILQALLTADVSKLIDTNYFDKNLLSDIDENMYRVNSQLNRKVNKAVNEGNERRLYRYMQRMDDTEFIQYSAWIDPRFFVIRKLILNNLKQNKTLTIEYNDYELVGRSLFPQHISLQFGNSKQNMAIDMKLSRPTVNKSKDFNIIIPEKYNQYNISSN
jgi:hypothetical protein